MAVAFNTDAHQISRAFAETIRDDPDARELYVQVDQGRIDVWLLISTLEFDDEDRFYEAGAELYRRFPGAPITFHVVNPGLFNPKTQLVGDVIPASADQVSLHT